MWLHITPPFCCVQSGNEGKRKKPLPSRGAQKVKKYMWLQQPFLFRAHRYNRYNECGCRILAFSRTKYSVELNADDSPLLSWLHRCRLIVALWEVTLRVEWCPSYQIPLHQVSMLILTMCPTLPGHFKWRCCTRRFSDLI